LVQPADAGGLQAIPQQLLPACEQLLLGNLAGIDFGQDRSLGCVVFVYDAGFALQHPPRFTAAQVTTTFILAAHVRQ
jgi:hypothetical protein